MKANAPLKLMYLNPVGTELYDAVFADMARTFKQPGTEVHIACLRKRTALHPHRVPLLRDHRFARHHQGDAAGGARRLRRARHRLLLRHGAARCARDIRRDDRDRALPCVLRDRGQPRQPLRHHRRAAQVGEPNERRRPRARLRRAPLRLLPGRARRQRLPDRPRGNRAPLDRGRAPRGGGGTTPKRSSSAAPSKSASTGRSRRPSACP